MPEAVTTLTGSETLRTVVQPAPVIRSTLQPAPVIRSTLAVGQGPAGPSGARAQRIRHDQTTPASPWVVNHNLGSQPLIEVFSAGGSKLLVQIVHTSANQALIYPDEPTTGFALCM